jgi:hypothetical protein
MFRILLNRLSVQLVNVKGYRFAFTLLGRRAFGLVFFKKGYYE